MGFFAVYSKNDSGNPTEVVPKFFDIPDAQVKDFQDLNKDNTVVALTGQTTSPPEKKVPEAGPKPPKGVKGPTVAEKKKAAIAAAQKAKTNH